MKFTADTAGLSRGMTKTEKLLSDISKSTRSATSAMRGLVAIELGKMFTSAVSSINSFIDKVRETVGELTRLAAVSNTSVERFQALAVAARTVGIEQDKLADIFKDMNDRVGDFLQTGGGPMADFFENIAPLVGVTAEQFRNLSGPEALQLYVDSLERAGLSQAEMVFYLEAISGDLTALLPLLRNGGEEFQALAERAERLGIVLSEDQVSAIQEMNGALSLVEATFQGIIGQVVGNLAPAVTAIAEEFLQFVEGYQGLGEGTGGTALADSITAALFDGAEYLADLLDYAVANLNDWGMSVESTFSAFQSTMQFFSDVAVGLSDSFYFLRSALNDFIASAAEVFAQFVANFSSSGAEFLNNYAQIMRQQAEQDRQRISQDSAAPPDAAEPGMFGSAVGRGRQAWEDSKSPEARAAREQERQQRENERQQRAQEADRKRQEQAAAKQAEQDQKKYNDALLKKQDDLLIASLSYEAERIDKLSAVNQKALQAADIRSGGIDQFIALATGREDPAVTEARKQLQELQRMREDLRALKALPVEIAGAA